MEIYTLEITFPHDEDEEPWVRSVEVEETTTLEKLHLFIQRVVEFDNDHLYEFYIAKSLSNRSESIPKRSKLNEVYPLTGYKLYYHFDFGDSWLFQIKKSRKRISADSNISYPRVTKSHGENPEQYPVYEE